MRQRLRLALTKEMRVEVVAVGIETEEQVKLMNDLGIYIMQGFYYSKPVEADEFEKKELMTIGRE